MNGEWVGPVNKGLLKATLVEASEPQYNDLLKFYTNKTWINCINSLITKDGGDFVFFGARYRAEFSHRRAEHGTQSALW